MDISIKIPDWLKSHTDLTTQDIALMFVERYKDLFVSVGRSGWGVYNKVTGKYDLYLDGESPDILWRALLQLRRDISDWGRGLPDVPGVRRLRRKAIAVSNRPYGSILKAIHYWITPVTKVQFEYPKADLPGEIDLSNLG